MTTGALRQVVPASLEFYFEIVARGTVCEGARLEQRARGRAAALRGLRARVGAGGAGLPLPGLRSAEVEMLRGNELEVESIEIEEESACTAPR